MKTKFKLGDKARDKISGFSGILTAQIIYLNGCDRWQITPDKLDKDGGLIEDKIFDEPQIELIKPEKIKKEKKSRRSSGGFTGINISKDII